MEDWAEIRRLSRAEGMPVRAIARKLGLGRNTVRRALADITVGGGTGDPAVDDNWGEPGLTPPERVFGWNSFEVLAFKAGNPENPVNAIPSSAFAHCQLRFVVGTDWENLEQHLRKHLDANGFSFVEISVERGAPATRLNPEDPWVTWAIASLEQTTGKKTAAPRY